MVDTKLALLVWYGSSVMTTDGLVALSLLAPFRLPLALLAPARFMPQAED